MERTVPVETTAEAYIELLAARGVDYFFGNGGTDFGPIVDAYAKRLSSELPVPKPITVPHEITAVSMAHGYTMITGRPQVVMVHTISGTANSIGSLINANRVQLPMLFSAGRTPTTEGQTHLRGARNGGIHWAQESFDQGSMVREWVKWDYELRPGVDLEGVVDRALAITQTAPMGPVYLTLPREVLAEERENLTYSDRPRMQPSETVASPESIRQAAEALVGARNPIVLAKSLGKEPAAVSALVRLAEALSLPVYDAGATHMNFPNTHPLHQTMPPRLEEADVVLVTENDVPWMPVNSEPNKDAIVIQLANDPLFQRYPLRTFAAHISLAGRTALTLDALTGAVLALRPDAKTVAERREKLAETHTRAREATRKRGEEGRAARPMSKSWVAYCLSQLVAEDTIIINELGLDSSQFNLTQPSTLFGPPMSGVLGWGLGASLGAKLASPNQMVVGCLGDGSYMFGVPSAGHWVSRRFNLPVLWLIWNNAMWNAVASATRGVFPDGWAVKTNSFPFSDLSPSLDFELICRSAGGFGERVEDPEDVPAALERAIHAVQVEKRQALLNFVAS